MGFYASLSFFCSLQSSFSENHALSQFDYTFVETFSEVHANFTFQNDVHVLTNFPFSDDQIVRLELLCDHFFADVLQW